MLHWRYELPCQDKLPEFHCTPILGCIRVLWLVFHPLGLELDKALFGWNSVTRASHTHALFRDDNSVVYYHLEKATRGTSYAASIKPFQKVKDGRGAWKALTSQYAGKDKWEAEIKCQEQLLHTRLSKGQSNFSLENFISQHRNDYVSMQASAEHVQYQLPNEHSRVGFLLEAIQCSDPGLQAAMASIKTDNGPEGMRNNFEATAAHLLPYDPVAKKR